MSGSSTNHEICSIIGLPVAMANLTKDALAGFSGSLTPYTIQGPATLYRFAGDPRGRGEWWIEESTFTMIYNEARDNCAHSGSNTTGTEFRRLYRKYIAVSLDWNDLLKFFRMDIPETCKAVGWIGKVKAQPLISDKEQNRLDRNISGILGGGLEQLFLESYDVSWIKKVSL